MPRPIQELVISVSDEERSMLQSLWGKNAQGHKRRSQLEAWDQAGELLNEIDDEELARNSRIKLRLPLEFYDRIESVKQRIGRGASKTSIILELARRMAERDARLEADNR